MVRKRFPNPRKHPEDATSLLQTRHARCHTEVSHTVSDKISHPKNITLDSPLKKRHKILKSQKGNSLKLEVNRVLLAELIYCTVPERQGI